MADRNYALMLSFYGQWENDHVEGPSDTPRNPKRKREDDEDEREAEQEAKMSWERIPPGLFNQSEDPIILGRGGNGVGTKIH